MVLRVCLKHMQQFDFPMRTHTHALTSPLYTRHTTPQSDVDAASKPALMHMFHAGHSAHFLQTSLTHVAHRTQSVIAREATTLIVLPFALYGMVQCHCVWCDIVCWYVFIIICPVLSLSPSLSHTGDIIGRLCMRQMVTLLSKQPTMRDETALRILAASSRLLPFFSIQQSEEALVRVCCVCVCVCMFVYVGERIIVCVCIFVCQSINEHMYSHVHKHAGAHDARGPHAQSHGRGGSV